MIVFDQFYEGYEEWYGTPAGAYVEKVETGAAFRLLSPEKGQRILDLGCGTGFFSRKLAALGCEVTGIDISKKMLDEAVQKAKQDGLDITFEWMDASRLSYADSSFDAVLSMAAFEFIKQPALVVAEAMRVLKPGGRLVIGTIQKGGDWARLYSSPDMAGTAYEHAVFQSTEMIRDLSPSQYLAAEGCLFLPPGLPDQAYTLEADRQKQSEGAKGGFVCVAFQKQ